MERNSIIMVDDDPWAVTATADLLRHEGFDIEIAETGEEGLELILHHPVPALILLDIHLPRMNGLEVLEEIRRRNIQVPIVVQSSHDRSSIIAAAMALGADAYLHKPVSPSLLLRTIRRFSKRHSFQHA